MSTYKIVARSRDRRRSVDTAPYPLYVEKDTFSPTPRRPSLYDDQPFFDDDRSAASQAIVLAEPSRRSRESRALVTYPALRRSKSQARFREDASIIEDDPKEESTDGKTYVRSRRRPGQRPAHALVRSKSQRRRSSNDDGHDLELKTSRTNRKFRDKRNDFENEEASVLVKAKHHERDRRSNLGHEDDYRPSDDGYYRARDWDTLNRRDRRPRIEVPSDDERDITVVPRNSRRRDPRDETGSQYSARSAYPRTERSYRGERSARSVRAQSPIYDGPGGNVIRKDGRLPRSEEWYYRQDRDLVDRMRGLVT